MMEMTKTMGWTTVLLVIGMVSTLTSAQMNMLNFENCWVGGGEQCKPPRSCLTRTSKGEIRGCISTDPLCMCADAKGVPACKSSTECSDGERCARIWFMAYPTCVSCVSLLAVYPVDRSACQPGAGVIAKEALSPAELGRMYEPPTNSVKEVGHVGKVLSTGATTSRSFQFGQMNQGLTGDVCMKDKSIVAKCKEPRFCHGRRYAHDPMPCSLSETECYCGHHNADAPPTGCTSSSQCEPGERCVVHTHAGGITMCVSCTSPFVGNLFRPVDVAICPLVT